MLHSNDYRQAIYSWLPSSPSREACGKGVASVFNSDCHYLLTVVHHRFQMYCVFLKVFLCFLCSYDHCQMKWGVKTCQELGLCEAMSPWQDIFFIVRLRGILIITMLVVLRILLKRYWHIYQYPFYLTLTFGFHANPRSQNQRSGIS